MKRKKKKNIRKLKYKNIFVFFFFGLLLFTFIYTFVNLSITNIYIKGNNLLTDQQVIEIAELENYPSTIKDTKTVIKNRLEKSSSIIKATVTKKNLTKVYIEIEENRPLFYNSNTNKIVMLDKTEIDGNVDTPYLLNYIPDTIYDKFLDAMINVDANVINRISEIEYKPNDIDKELFYLAMDDGNYVYLTLSTFDKINNYITMIEKFENKKGILYLDSGEYFEIK